MSSSRNPIVSRTITVRIGGKPVVLASKEPLTLAQWAIREEEAIAAAKRRNSQTANQPQQAHAYAY